MIRVAILTLYYNNANYGGLLQACALQKVIANLGYECQQISYDLNSGYLETQETSLNWSKRIKNVVLRVKNYAWRQHYKEYCSWLKPFANQIPHTSVVNADTIGNLTLDYDAFVCGSDQIWNPIGWQPTLFLDFVKEPKGKIAYSASIATNELSNEEIEYIRKYIGSFDAVSVREQISADILNKHFQDMSIEVMPDPTLLLSADEWLEYISECKINAIEEPYIFAYFLGSDIGQRDACIKFAKDNGIKIYFIPYMNRSVYGWEKKHKNKMLLDVGVNEFLSLIKNAEFVLTDSFHGTVFSAIFHKPFYVLDRTVDFGERTMNSRIVSLLETLEIRERYIKDLGDMELKYMSETEIELIKKNIRKLKKRGIEYLKNNIGEIVKLEK